MRGSAKPLRGLGYGLARLSRASKGRVRVLDASGRDVSQPALDVFEQQQVDALALALKPAVAIQAVGVNQRVVTPAVLDDDFSLPCLISSASSDKVARA